MARRSSKPEEETDRGIKAEHSIGRDDVKSAGKNILDGSTDNHNDNSKTRDLVLKLHSGDDHNGAFHRDPDLTATLTSPERSPAPLTDPSEPIPTDLKDLDKELDDEDDWNEPEDRLDKADMHDAEDDDEEY